MLLARLALLIAVLPASALAQQQSAQDALARLEESFALRVEEHGWSAKDLVPAIVVSVQPAFEETRAWYPSAALATLSRVFGASALRSCEACMAPRLHVEEGRLEQVTGTLGTAEILRLDESSRGSAAPARCAVWLDETSQGVSLRVVDLRNSAIVLAENFDAEGSEPARTQLNFKRARELERRTRGDSITHTFIDAVLYPGQHISLDWTEQWGETNANLSGLSVSFIDPILGIGGSYYRVIPSAWNLTVGAQVLVSLPTAIVRSVSSSSADKLENLLTGALLVRVPIASTNYGVTLSVSTNGKFGIGISLMNFSLLPFLP